MSEEQKMRAFIALSIPISWQEEFEALQTSLKRELPFKSIRWVNSCQIHLTLRFLGYILPDETNTVSDLLLRTAATVQPFTVYAKGLGVFPSPSRPRVLWVGLDGAVSHLEKLQRSINEVTCSVGEKPEDRPFKAHLTLARLKDLDRAEARQLASVIQRGYQAREPWKVGSIDLFRSHLGPSGARYDLLSSHVLSSLPS
jgi:RNA 2',3'-cyclic 3'-phosphodiesterase